MLAHLADVSIRSLLLALSAAIVLWTLRSRRTAALQHAVWTVVVCGMLALFAFGQALPRLPLRVLTSPAARKTGTPLPVPDSIELVSSATLPGGTGDSVPAFRPSIDWNQVAVYAYAAIAFAFLARFLTGMFLVRRLLAKSATVGDFRESGLIAVPLTVGWLRPKILLPLEWREWDREKLDAVLVHEAAHVRRRDGLVAALAGINRCLFWFHPLAWMLERRLRLLAELACDEACVATLGDREQYARLLLDMARVVDGARGRLQSHALTMAATFSHPAAHRLAASRRTHVLTRPDLDGLDRCDAMWNSVCIGCGSGGAGGSAALAATGAARMEVFCARSSSTSEIPRPGALNFAVARFHVSRQVRGCLHPAGRAHTRI